MYIITRNSIRYSLRVRTNVSVLESSISTSFEERLPLEIFASVSIIKQLSSLYSLSLKESCTRSTVSFCPIRGYSLAQRRKLEGIRMIEDAIACRRGGKADFRRGTERSIDRSEKSVIMRWTQSIRSDMHEIARVRKRARYSILVVLSQFYWLFSWSDQVHLQC